MAEQAAGGYNYKILRVNLTKGAITTEETDERFCRKYIGGAGFVAHFLLKELAPGIDPLGPENKMVFAIGPLTGTSFSGSARHCVGAKSPLTGGIAKSEGGEFWGVELKRAGFDIVIIEGKSPRPVYLWIHDNEAELKDAGHLWGKNTKETQEVIRTELGDDKVRTALIGPGGENLVKYANIMHGLYDAAGRGGLGAVMGSKNLKAICVRGHKPPPVKDPEGVKELRQWMVENLQLMKGFREFGTGSGIAGFEAAGNLPTRNFRDGSFPQVNKISPQAIKETVRVGMDACFACAVRCKKAVQFDEPYSADPAYGGPEYETIGALGSNCLIDDLKAICRGSELCNAYGIDTISTGCTISFAMECFENGLLTTKDTGGIELKFGNAEAMLKMIDLIARREGIGDQLAEGSARMAERLGKEAAAFAIHVKKMELPMHEPRLNKSLAIGYMVNPHGADHCCNMIDLVYSSGENVLVKDTVPLGMDDTIQFHDSGPRRVALFRLVQLKRIIQDSLSVCMFLPYSYEQLAKVTAAVTGWNTTPAEQLRVAERTLTMLRMFNTREGFTPDDDKLPKRFFEPTTAGALAKTALDPKKMDKAKRYYYTLMGWDVTTGIPLPEKLEELEIG